MIFENIHKAKEWFRNYQELKTKDKIPFFTYDYDWNSLSFGNWLCFQHIKTKMGHSEPILISRPILGLFVGTTVWDMALVVEIVENRRAWMWCHSIGNEKYNKYIVLHDHYVESFPLWSENIYVLGTWKQKPIFEELRKSLNKKIQ